MPCNNRRFLQNILYLIVLIEILLVVGLFPVAFIDRESTVEHSEDSDTKVTKRSVDSTYGMPSSLRVIRGNGTGTSSPKMAPVNMSAFLDSLSSNSSSVLQSLNVTSGRNILNCREIDDLNIEHYVGKGTTKSVYKSFIGERPVAVKMVTRKVKDITACKHRKGKNNIDSCFRFANYKVIKEIALLQQLQHPNIAKLLGYCIRNEGGPVGSTSTESVRMVTEYGEPHNVRTMTWPVKLQVALDLAELLHFLHHSPIGPIRIGDFKRDQFRLVNGTLKLSDLDDLTTEQLACTHRRNCYIMGKDMGVPCLNFFCKNFNTVANVKVAKELFFRPIFKATPSHVTDEAQDVISALSAPEVDTDHIRDLIVSVKRKCAGLANR